MEGWLQCGCIRCIYMAQSTLTVSIIISLRLILLVAADDMCYYLAILQ